MSLLVKICGLRDAGDVDVALNAGANAIGFVFAESPRRVQPDEARRAARGVGDSAIRVAVMRHPANDEWLRVLDGFRPDVLQTDIGDFESLEIPDDIRRWPVVRENDMQPDTQIRGTFLYEGSSSGSGETVDWQRAATVAADRRMILAGGLDADNVAAAIRIVQPYGVDVSSGVESEPGRKSPELIRRFIGAARAAEKEL